MTDNGAKRWVVGGHVSAIHRLTFMVGDPDPDDRTNYVAVMWGEPGCDPVWFVERHFRATPVVRLLDTVSGWLWDRSVRRQEARRVA